MIGAFLTVFGVLAVDEQLRVEWIGTAGDELFHFELFGERLELTTELLRVAAGLAAFSGFYFAIAMFTDSTYRAGVPRRADLGDARELRRPGRVPGPARPGRCRPAAGIGHNRTMTETAKRVMVPGYRHLPGQPLRIDRAAQPARLPRGRDLRGDGVRPRRRRLLLLRRRRRAPRPRGSPTAARRASRRTSSS